jgi:hypothetical protein
MPSIARTSTEFSDDRVEDEQFHDHRSDDFDNSSSSSSNSLAEDARGTGPGIRSLDTDEHSDSRGPRVPETERNEHRPSTTGEREEQFYEDDSQISESIEESDNGSDDGATLIGDVGNGNHPRRYAEHRRLSVVEVTYVSLSMPLVRSQETLMCCFSLLLRTCRHLLSPLAMTMTHILSSQPTMIAMKRKGQ